MSSASPVGAIQHARNRMWRTALRRNLQDIAIGKEHHFSVDIRNHDGDTASVLDRFTKPFRIDSDELLRLIVVFRNSGQADSAIESLAAKSRAARCHSARILGALRMPQAVSWLAPLLESKERDVSEAAARALGRIGGYESAQALLVAIQRTGLRRTFIAQLARAAPDLFLEVTLTSHQRPGVRPAAALAAGLRRRHTSVAPLIALLMNGSPRERAISCRSLGWIGSSAATSAITAALEDPEWKVRVAAAKALRALHAEVAVAELERLRGDRNSHVRRASREALRRLWRDNPWL